MDEAAKNIRSVFIDQAKIKVGRKEKEKGNGANYEKTTLLDMHCI